MGKTLAVHVASHLAGSGHGHRVRPEYVVYMMGTAPLSNAHPAFAASSLWYPRSGPAMRGPLPLHPPDGRAVIERKS
jgi:hypothetical protein